MGRWTETIVDPMRRPVSIVDPKGQATTLVWCSCGSLEKLIDPNGHTTSWFRDAQNRVVQKKDGDGSMVSYVYENETSRLKSVTDAKNQTTTYSYLKDNRLSGVYHSDPHTPDVSLEYDSPYGRVSKRTDGIGETNYTYRPVDANLGAGRLATVNGPWANDTISYSYDELGRVLSRVIKNDAGVPTNTASVTYDSLSRPATVTNELDAFTYAYDGNTSRLASVSSPNGPARTFTYLNEASDHQLSEILNKTGAGVTLSKFNYTYYDSHQIKTWTQQADSDPAKIYSFQYDAASRLTGALFQTAGVPQSVVHSYAYGYDAAGNRSSEQVDGMVTSSLFNADNELASQQPGGALAVSGTTGEAATVTIQGQPAATDPTSTAFAGQAAVSSGTTNVVVAAKDASGNMRTNTYSVTVSGNSGTLTYDGSCRSSGGKARSAHPA